MKRRRCGVRVCTSANDQRSPKARGAIWLDYHLERVDSEWKIVDYDVDGMDTVSTYRRQFRRLLRRESVLDVIARLERRIADYEAEQP